MHYAIGALARSGQIYRMEKEIINVLHLGRREDEFVNDLLCPNDSLG